MQTQDDSAEAKVFAYESSYHALPLGPTNVTSPYPLPQDLRKALEWTDVDPPLTGSALHYKNILKCLSTYKNISSNHYWFMMKLLLYLDYYQCMVDMEQYTLYRQRINQSKSQDSSYLIYVPGLSEDRPSVRARDLVVITQHDTTSRYLSRVEFVGDKYLVAKMCAEFVETYTSDTLYDIQFLYPEYCFKCTHFAVDRAMKANLLPILFPRGQAVSRLPGENIVSWINPSLANNPEQQQAVRQIAAKSAFPAPYILFGPPGTGKTSTLVEAISQILNRDPSQRILICTPSNAAADEVARRLLKNHVDARDIHRMYSASRDSKDITEDLRLCSNFTEDEAIFIAPEIIVRKKVVITTLITCHRLISYGLRENHFSYVFLDEAGQATEPETLIPLSLMSSHREGHVGRIHGQIVLAGDPKQLGPSLQSRIAEPLLGVSMLERLMEWDIYRKDMNNKYNPTYVTKLVQNYRCHPAILQLPNKLFYDGDLQACGGEHTQRAINWKTLPNPDFPIIFHAVDGKEGRESHSPSVFNSEEISVVMTYVSDLLKSNLGGRGLKQSEIGIVTPYKLQRIKIHEKLKANNWNDISVGTVETFQGQEKDVIIITTVRSALYVHNGRVHVGFLSNPKRFNVAITRAKALLIVVGNPAILQVDEYWRSLITYCLDNKASRGSKILLQRYISRATLRARLGKKHVAQPMLDFTAPLEVIDVAPEEKQFPLPQRDPTRRRRFPVGTDLSDSSSACDSDSYDDFAFDDGGDENTFDPCRYLMKQDDFEDENGSDHDTDDENDDGEDEFEMEGIFSAGNSSRITELNSDPIVTVPNDNSDNSWETATSSEMADQSDESSKSEAVSIGDLGENQLAKVLPILLNLEIGKGIID